MSIEGEARIIEAAKRVISKNGITGATMRGIAEEAGLSTGAIYHYYKSKEEVLYDVMDESLSVSARILEETRGHLHSREEIIKEICENISKRFEKNDENHLQFYLAQEAILGNDELKKKFFEKYKEWIDSTEELIKHLYCKKQTKYDRAFATLLIGAVDGVVMQSLMGVNPAQIEDVIFVYNEIVKEGIPKFLEHLSKI